MKRRLLVMLGLLTLFWVVARELRKRFNPTAAGGPEQGMAGGTSIDQLVRSEPLQPSASPAAVETAEPSEAEAVTPPHGDPLAQDLTTGAEDHSPIAPAEAAVEERPEEPADGTANGSQPPGSEPD